MSQLRPQGDVESRRLAHRSALHNELILAAAVVTVNAAAVAVLASLVVFGAGSLLLVATIAIVNVACLLLVPVVIQYAVPPWLERRQLRAISRGEHPLSVFVPYDYAKVSATNVFLPLLLAVPLGFTFVFLGYKGARHSLISGGPLHESVMPWISGLFYAGAALMTFAFAYHRVPNSRRSVKYATLLWGSGFIQATMLLAQKNSSIHDIMFWAVLSVTSSTVIFAYMRFRLRPTAPLVPRDASTLRAIRWRRQSMAYGPQPGPGQLVWMIIKAIPLLGDIFWAGRIYSKERLARAPVLFLRSFSHKDSSLLLAKVVAPAVSRASVVAALVHPSQTTASPNKQTHEAWTPITIGVANDDWREWYLNQVESALAVVVDADILSDATRWELENAYRLLGHDRVAVLGAVGTAQRLSGYLVFEYVPSNFYKSKCEVANWIDYLMSSTFEHSSPMGAVRSFPPVPN